MNLKVIFKYLVLSILIVTVAIAVAVSPILVLHYFNLQSFYVIGQIFSLLLSVFVVRWSLDAVDWIFDRTYKTC